MLVPWLFDTAVDGEPPRPDYDECARHTPDCHHKLAVEGSQVVTTALTAMLGPLDVAVYGRPTHTAHPWCKWAAESPANVEHVINMSRAVCDEYSRRSGGKVHATTRRLEAQRRLLYASFPNRGVATQPPLCVDSCGAPLAQYIKTTSMGSVARGYQLYFALAKQLALSQCKDGRNRWVWRRGTQDEPSLFQRLRDEHRAAPPPEEPAKRRRRAK